MSITLEDHEARELLEAASHYRESMDDMHGPCDECEDHDYAVERLRQKVAGAKA